MKLFLAMNTILIIKFLLTSSKSADEGVIPAKSFHTKGASGRANGFFVLIAIPNKIPENNITKINQKEKYICFTAIQIEIKLSSNHNIHT